MISQVADQTDKIIDLCKEHHVKVLEIVGSAATGDFHPSMEEEIEFLVDFHPNPNPNRSLLKIYFKLEQELSSLLACPVGLIMWNAKGFSNPYFRERIEQTRTRLYAS